MSRRDFGNFGVAIISAGRLFESEPAFPPDGAWRSTAELDRRGRVVHGLNVAVAQGAGATIVIDPAFFQAPAEAAGYFDAEMTENAEDALARLDIRPEDVTHVLVTHGHRDHYWSVLDGGDGFARSRFQNAEHFLPALDWEPPPGGLIGGAQGDSFHGVNEQELVDRLHRYLEPVRADGRLRLFERRSEPVAGVVLDPTGGESEGHAIVRIGDGPASFTYLGDLIHFPVEVADPKIAPTRLDRRQRGDLTAARQRILARLVGEEGVAVYIHAPFPGWGRIEADADGWAWVPLS